MVEGEHRCTPGLPPYLFLRRGANTPNLSEHTGDARPSTLAYFYVDDIVGGEGGIRTHVPVTRQTAFEAVPLRPLRYLSA